MNKTVRKNKIVYILAHNIRSLYNVGAFFRTAESLGVTGVWLTGYSGTPNNPKLAKVSLGAEKLVPWEYSKTPKDALSKLKARYGAITAIALENNIPQKTVLLQHFKPTFPLVIIVGNEVVGMSSQVLKQVDIVVEIGMKGKKESLNVSVALGIALFHILR